MHFLPLPFLALLPTIHAALNGRCTDNSNPPLGPGSWPADGICIHTSTCKSAGGVYASGWCPDDPKDIKCCYVNTCDKSHGDGYSYCEWTNHRCPTGGTPGYFKSGLCPGGDNYKCCVFGP